MLIITYIVALAQLSYIVAGSAEMACGGLSGMAILGHYTFKFFIPTLLATCWRRRYDLGVEPRLDRDGDW
ncbi:MAG: hypothetical protein KGQ79_11400 [Proteobacteria bacterium]|nr:hypothetical protein [Pseudomonadota bacterium]